MRSLLCLEAASLVVSAGNSHFLSPSMTAGVREQMASPEVPDRRTASE